MSQTPVEPQITGKMFLYERPELLNKETHGGLSMRRAEKPFGFCAKIRAVPVTAGELPAAMKTYPIIFSADKDMVMLAAVGVIDDVNLFVDEEGLWDPLAYVPGYVRRYPFGLANETGTDRFAIVIDTAWEGFDSVGQFPLFQGGEPSEATQSAVEFCKQYEAERRGTQEALQRLEAYNLVTPQSVQYTPTVGGEPITFTQYYGVDERRYSELTDDKYLELRKSGLLPLIHAQMFSLGNWRTLVTRRARRFGLNEDQALKPLNLV